ncbi:MAG: hypothetical protein ACRDRK_08895 [Pseudonocardia sp.]
MVGLRGEHQQRAVGEDGVVAPGGEQLTLARWVRRRTRRTISHAVTRWLFLLSNAVWLVSAASASGTQRCPSASKIAFGYFASAADDARAAVAVAVALVHAFGGDRRGMVWSAFSRPEQDGLAARVTNAREAAEHAEIDLRHAVTTAKAREAEEARRAAEAEDARTAEQERVAAEQGRIAAATQARRKAKPAVQAPAPPARSATTTDAPQPGPVANPYPGYTGPRCYAPGGKTWKPC